MVSSSLPAVVSPGNSAQEWLQQWQLNGKQSTKNLQCKTNGAAGLGNHLWEFMHCAAAAAISNRIMVYTYGAKLKPFLDVPITFHDPKLLPAVTLTLEDKAQYYSCHDLNELFGSAAHVQVALTPGGCHMFVVGYYLYMNPFHRQTMLQVFGAQPYRELAKFFFRPRSDIAQRVESFSATHLRPYKTIGLHIRYHPSTPHSEMFFIGEAQEHARAFITCIGPWIEEFSNSGQEWRIYLGTDSSVVRDTIVQEYGANRVLGLGFDTPPDNGNDEALVTDLWTLMETNYFAGTFYSSLSAFVATMRPAGLPTRYVLRSGQCILSRQVETFWPDEQLMRMYPGFHSVVDDVQTHGCYNETIGSEFGLDWVHG